MFGGMVVLLGCTVVPLVVSCKFLVESDSVAPVVEVSSVVVVVLLEGVVAVVGRGDLKNGSAEFP